MLMLLLISIFTPCLTTVHRRHSRTLKIIRLTVCFFSAHPLVLLFQDLAQFLMGDLGDRNQMLLLQNFFLYVSLDILKIQYNMKNVIHALTL